MTHPAPPEPPLPAATAAPPPVLPPTPPHCTYRELYGDDMNNPPADRVAQYFSGYRFTAEPDGAAVPTPAALLRDQTITLSDCRPMALLVLVTDQGGRYKVVVLHRMMRYMDSPGGDPSGYHDQVQGLLGNIMPHQFQTVEVPRNAFHLVGMPAKVPTVAAMAALIPTWDDATPTRGPYTTEVAGETEEVVRIRHIQIVPGRYAAILVQSCCRVPPKIAYQEIVGAIQA